MATPHPCNLNTNPFMVKKINDIKDVTYFRTNTIAYKNLVTFIDALCIKIHGCGPTFKSSNYQIKDTIIKKCSEFLDCLREDCEKTDLKLGQTGGTNRFGLTAFRDWFDQMKISSSKFIDREFHSEPKQFREELLHYFSESFGNRMRIDYGTGHELNFIIFSMGLCNIWTSQKDLKSQKFTSDNIKDFVNELGFDLLYLFNFKYIQVCRDIQTKFRLEPAGSRGVYNMDDYQFLPFLFGAAQLTNSKKIIVENFFKPDIVEKYREDYIFFEALDFILKNKKGPFEEHSYTLWNYSSLGSWENMYRRIRSKFDDEILSPFPIVQHLLFGTYILSWDKYKA